MSLLYFLVVIRGFVSVSVTTFVPVLLARRGASVTLAAAGVAAYFAGGGLGGFFGGSLADTVGHRRVILMSMLLPVPFLVAAPIVPPSLTLVSLALAGFFLQSTLPVNVSFGQLIAPVSAATVASLLMGFAWGLGRPAGADDRPDRRSRRARGDDGRPRPRALDWRVAGVAVAEACGLTRARRRLTRPIESLSRRLAANAVAPQRATVGSWIAIS